jgi:hypothetical protein
MAPPRLAQLFQALLDLHFLSWYNENEPSSSCD